MYRFLSRWGRLWRWPSVFNISYRWPTDRISALKNENKTKKKKLRMLTF
jgi:hypothetical protein